jgi:hypothetical protein
VQAASVPIRLGLKVHSTLPSSDLVIRMALYTEPDGSALASRDEFDATLGNQLAGLSQLSLSTFPLGSNSRGGRTVELYIAGSGIPGQVPANLPANEVFQLPCPRDYGGCDGVYPLQVSLVDTVTSQPVDSFTTYVVVVPPAVASQGRLRFSFIVPEGASVALAPNGTPDLTGGTRARLETIATEEAAWPGVPLTIDLYGQALLAISETRQNTVLLSNLASGYPGAIIPGPFSAVDPTQLVRADLETDLADQLLHGDQVFASSLRTTASPQVYVATSPIGTHGLAALAADGVTQIVVPESNLASMPSSGPASVEWPSTLSAPFRVGGFDIEGLQADSGLAAHLTGSGSPALRAQQLLADLAEVYFDSPDFPQSRGVALVAPESWNPQIGFLNALLSGLASSPIVTTLPVTQLLESVHRGTCQEPPSFVTGCSPAVRALVSPRATSPGEPITATGVQTARDQLAELSSMIPTATGADRNLEDSILLAETAGLAPRVRQAYLSAPLAAMLQLGSKLTLPTRRIVTVTSSSAKFPVAIASASETPVHVVLTISGANLNATARVPVVLTRGTTTVIVRVRTRTLGDSSLQLELVSPVGHVELTSGEFTLRCTAFSDVAIALTVSAGAFLVFWWVQSASRRRRRRAVQRGEDPPKGPAPETVPDAAR